MPGRSMSGGGWTGGGSGGSSGAGGGGTIGGGPGLGGWKKQPRGVTKGPTFGGGGGGIGRPPGVPTPNPGPTPGPTPGPEPQDKSKKTGRRGQGASQKGITPPIPAKYKKTLFANRVYRNYVRAFSAGEDIRASRAFSFMQRQAYQATIKGGRMSKTPGFSLPHNIEVARLTIKKLFG